MQFIRNATLRLTYNGHLFIIDPYLAPKHSLPSYTGKSPNPLVELPIPIEQVLDGIEMAIISHLHSDHFDSVAYERVPKTLPIFCQPGDEEFIRGKGFEDVTPIEHEAAWQGISMTRTTGRHGTGETATLMGNVSGFVLRAEGEPTIYWAGDTIFYEPVQQVISEHQPDIIIVHSGGAVWGEDTNPIIMNAVQTIAVCQFAPNATVIATHMEALDHCLTSRSDLRTAAEFAGVSAERLLIPADGEILMLSTHRTTV